MSASPFIEGINRHTFNNRREDPSAHESTNFPDSGGGTIELATYSSGTGFASKETKAVARTKLAKAQEDAVDHLRTVSELPSLCYLARNLQQRRRLLKTAGCRGRS